MVRLIVQYFKTSDMDFREMLVQDMFNEAEDPFVRNKISERCERLSLRYNTGIKTKVLEVDDKL